MEQAHPGAARPLSLRATPPTEGILKGSIPLLSSTSKRIKLKLNGSQNS